MSSSIENNHVKGLLQGISIALLLRISGAALGLIYTIVLARVLGAEGAGIYYLALTVITIGSIIGRVGVDRAVLRFTAAHADQEEWQHVAGVYRKAVGFVLIGSSIITILVFGSSHYIAQNIFREPGLLVPLRLMAFAILPYSLLTIHGEALKGLERVGSGLFLQMVGVPLISLPLLAFLGNHLGVLGASVSYLVGSITVYLIGIVIWRRATPQLRDHERLFKSRVFISTVMPLFWLSLILIVMEWTDTIMLGILIDSESVGVYGVTLRMARLLTFILVAVNSTTAPRYAALYERGNTRGLQQLAQSSARFMVMVSLPLVLVYLILPRIVLGIFGSSFTEGATTLSVLAIGQLINLMAGSVVYLLLMSGKQNVVSQVVTGIAGLNILLNYILIKVYGILGAGIATSLTMIISNLVLAWKVYRELGVVSLAIPKVKNLLSSY